MNYQLHPDPANTTMSSTSTTSSSSSSGELGPYFTWFLKAVAKWLDIALFKAVQRILKVGNFKQNYIVLRRK